MAVLDELGIRQAHFWGYSMGGAVAFMIGKWAPARFRSLVIGGEDPFPPSKVPASHSIPQHKRVQGLPLRQTPYRWGEQIAPILPHFPIPALLYGGEAEACFSP